MEDLHVSLSSTHKDECGSRRPTRWQWPKVRRHKATRAGKTPLGARNGNGGTLAQLMLAVLWDASWPPPCKGTARCSVLCWVVLLPQRWHWHRQGHRACPRSHAVVCHCQRLVRCQANWAAITRLAPASSGIGTAGLAAPKQSREIWPRRWSQGVADAFTV